MGCFGGKKKPTAQPPIAAQPAAVPPPVQPALQAPPAQAPPAAQPQAAPADEGPKPFAVMRMTHEAFRAAFKETIDLCNVGDFAGAALTFNALAQTIPVHTRQEESSLFPMLSKKFPNECRFMHSSSEHAAEAQIIGICHEFLQRAQYGQSQGCAAQIMEFQAMYEKHMKAEEDMMMPVTEKTAATVQERGALMHAVLNVDMPSFERIQIPFVVRMLDMHRPPGMLKNFVQGLQYCSTPSEFAHHAQNIRSIARPESVSMLEKAGCLSQGKLPEGFPGLGSGPMVPVLQAYGAPTPQPMHMQPPPQQGTFQPMQPPPQQGTFQPMQPPPQQFLAGPPSVQAYSQAPPFSPTRSFYAGQQQLPPPSIVPPPQLLPGPSIIPMGQMQGPPQPQMMIMQLQQPPTVMQQQIPMQMQTGGFQPMQQPFMQPGMGRFGERESDL